MPRPSTADVIARLDEHTGLMHADYGGLPRAVEADEILREIWIEDTYHSSALEGNALSRKQVEHLLETDHASGRLSDTLEVRGYASAARWVYQHAPDHPPGEGVPVSAIRTVHTELQSLAWRLSPPDDGTQPGQWRRRGAKIAGSTVQTPPPIAIDGVLADWMEATGAEGDHEHWLYHLADLHAWFERIHPFADGNGRAGRLLMNFMLLQRGYPPAVFDATERERYLRALARADAGNSGMLAELIARAVETNITKLLIPRLAGDVRLIPLGALAAESQYSPGYLRTLAANGRLRAVREGKLWLSSRTWLEEYKVGRQRARRPGSIAVRPDEGG